MESGFQQSSFQFPVGLFWIRTRVLTLIRGALLPAELIAQLEIGNAIDFRFSVLNLDKGGDPAAPSSTATLLRLHPSH
jgi:hypothetical protein